MTQLFHKPKQPDIPDYAGLAQQQAQANQTAATQTAKLGSPNETTPWGSITRQYDPTSGQFNYTTTLTPDQEKLFQGGEDINLAKMDLGKTKIGNLSDLWSKAFDTSGMTPRQTSVTPSNLQNGYATKEFSFDTGGAPNYQSSVPGFDFIKNVSGQDYQTDPGAAPDYQKSLDLSGLGSRPTLDFGNLPALPGVGDFSADRQKVEDSLYQQQTNRLDPQWKLQEQQLRDRLYSQGIREGNPAWTQAFDDFNRQKMAAYSDARLSSISGAGQEQSRLFGMASTARQQAANEALQAAGFQLDSRSQGVSEALTQGNFANAVTQLERAYGLDRQSAINTATQLQNALNLSSAQFTNTAGAAQFDQGMQQANLENQVAQLQSKYGLDRQAAINAATQLENQTAAQKATFNNTAESQGFDERMANAVLANQSRGQEMDEAAYLRSLPFNEFNAITSGTQVTQPNFSGPTVAPSVGAAPVYQAGQDAYTAAYNKYAQEMANLNAMWSAIGGIGGAVATGGASSFGGGGGGGLASLLGSIGGKQ